MYKIHMGGSPRPSMPAWSAGQILSFQIVPLDAPAGPPTRGQLCWTVPSRIGVLNGLVVWVDVSLDEIGIFIYSYILDQARRDPDSTDVKTDFLQYL